MLKLRVLILCCILFPLLVISQSLPDPGSLHGVHWNTHTIATFDNAGKLLSATVEADPLNISDDEKIKLCSLWGLNCIALKINDGGQLTEDFPGSTGSDDKSIWNNLTLDFI